MIMVYAKLQNINKKTDESEEFICFFVRLKGLEPPRLSAPDPKSGAATNYATAALWFLRVQRYILFSVSTRLSK